MSFWQKLFGKKVVNESAMEPGNETVVDDAGLVSEPVQNPDPEPVTEPVMAPDVSAPEVAGGGEEW
jgi:hypothetical protein